MAPTQNLAGPSNVDTDCCASCTFHRDAIISACTHAKNRDELARLLPCICSTPKPWRMKDTSGKSMFHMAASMGREEIMTWYLKCRGESSLRTPQEKSALVDEVDAESGWTALHRALFQGEIAAASWLLRQGADISIKDHDDCSPVQLLIWDQQNLSEAIMITESSPKAKGACYPVAFHTWGNNANYTLGYGGATQDRVVPEKVRAAFYGQPNSECINCGHSDTVMGRSVARGEVHIHGAHLPPGALMSEHLLETYLPSVVDNYTNRQGLALDVVLRKFHTIFLSPDGVFVCGHGQGGRLGLGSEKTCLTPTRISFRSLAKAEPPQIVRIAAGVNHSVFLDADGIAYSCGLNEFFQLGMSPPPISLMVPTALPSFHSLTHRRSRSQAAVGVPVYHGIIGIAAERCHTLAWSSEAIYAIGFNGGQLGPRRDRSKGVSPGGSTSDASDLTNLLPREMTELKQYLPARFVRCSDAAFVIYRDPAYAGVPDMVLVHDYEIKRLPRLPRLSGVMWKEPPALSEICVFGGKLTLPGREMSLNRDLVIVALVSDIPLLYVDSGRSSYWSVINISGLPRNMSSIYHISLSSDQLLVSTEFGEVYTIPFSQSDRNKVTAHGPTPPRAAERVAKLWRALKVFSEPGSRSFAALQRSAPFRLWPMETHQSNGVSRTRHSPSTDTSVLIVADRGAINVHIEKLYLVAGSTYFRNLLPEFLDDSTFPAVLKIPGKIPSHVKFHRAVDDAKKLAQWQEIRRDFYPTARGLWDVEPDMEVVCDEDGATIGTHRFKLTSRTLYFELLLEGERWRNSRQTHTAVLPCDLPTGLRFMEFLYEKRISDRPATAEECLGLLRVADFIMDDELRAVAAEFFRPFLTADTVVNFLRIAEMYNAEGLRMSCVELMLCMLPELFESRHLTDLDKTTLNLLSTVYKKKMKSSLSTRIITPHYIPGLDFDQVSRTSPREYIPDDNQDSGDNIRLRGKSFAKRSVLEIPPKNNVLKDRNSDHKMLAPVEAAGDWTQVSPSGKRNGPEKRNEPLSPMVPRSVVDNICSSLKNIPPEINGKTPSSAAVSPNTSFRESDDEGCVLSPSPSSSPKAKYVAPAFRIHDGIDLTPAKVPAALSAIMEEERRALAFKLEKATPLNRPKTGSHSRHGRKFVGVKLQATDAVVEEAAGKELESTRPRSNPWNRALPVGPTFMEVMAMEEEETKKAAAFAAVTAAKTSPVVVPPSKPTLHVPSQPWSIQPAASKSTPSTSFNSISPLTSPNPVSSFLTIQREEQSQLFELQKSRSRPLHLIQAEERAVDELLEFYGARDNPEEWITVERVLPKLAAASWYPRSH